MLLRDRQPYKKNQQLRTLKNLFSPSQNTLIRHVTSGCFAGCFADAEPFRLRFSAAAARLVLVLIYFLHTKSQHRQASAKQAVTDNVAKSGTCIHACAAMASAHRNKDKPMQRIACCMLKDARIVHEQT